jgi:hypothetical protein
MIHIISLNALYTPNVGCYILGQPHRCKNQNQNLLHSTCKWKKHCESLKTIAEIYLHNHKFLNLNPTSVHTVIFHVFSFDKLHFKLVWIRVTSAGDVDWQNWHLCTEFFYPWGEEVVVNVLTNFPFISIFVSSRLTNDVSSETWSHEVICNNGKR